MQSALKYWKTPALATNGKIEADLYFQVPKDDAELTLHYESSIWSEKTINIKK